ncbi:MAG TPA: hypothetical protein VMY42_13905 [Thermoguttaceae bacterium]|nr:hypothetical protein [Thermoguttaceae bacterium]
MDGYFAVARNLIQKYCRLPRPDATQATEALSVADVRRLAAVAREPRDTIAATIGGILGHEPTPSPTPQAPGLMMTPEFLIARNVIQKHCRLARADATATAERLPVADVRRLAAVANEPRARIAATIGDVLGQAPPADGPAIKTVKMRGQINHATGTGPYNGQYALQRALRRRIARDKIDWLTIDGPAEPGELLWAWCWADIPELLGWDILGRPWVTGPNILFEKAAAPLAGYGEKQLANSPNCRAIFTESDWYADLIRCNLGPRCTAPVVLWRYPIDPTPPPPVDPPTLDLLVYAKSGPADLADQLAARFPRSKILRYGDFHRDELYQTARRARACAYLSDDDRGPLALAEIMLSGCPACGIERGAPWCEPGQTGLLVEALDADQLTDAVEALLEWDRHKVRQAALDAFAPDRTVSTILKTLDRARRQ